ncbi:MAG: 1-acyl-sn-glycerol-3-phosphate acyltransferase [Melioribacteraceae bacterium]|nr:1-acyl-sn-glycerol-3-phosphate acyltransferase [Melioribacteraceae bacterium]
MMKIVTEYDNILAKQDVYKTPVDAEKKSSLPTELRFFPNLLHIFFYANKLTRKNIYNRYNWVNSSKMIMDGLEKVGVKIEIDGMHNLSSFDGPAVFIGNHMSTLETIALPRIINPVKPVVFVTKEELNSTPLFGPINSSRHPIIVSRKNAREDLMQVMKQGAERLEDGRSIILFPQKTRTPIFDQNNFNTLGIKLAKRNNVPVVPIALLTDAWGNGKIMKEFGKIDISKKVHFSFGKPMEITGNGSEQHKQVVEFIISHLKKWGREELILE